MTRADKFCNYCCDYCGLKWFEFHATFLDEIGQTWIKQRLVHAANQSQARQEIWRNYHTDYAIDNGKEIETYCVKIDWIQEHDR